MIKLQITILFCFASLNLMAQSDFKPLSLDDFDLKGDVKSATIEKYWKKSVVNFDKNGFLKSQKITNQMSDDGFSSAEESYYFYSNNRIDSVVNYNYSGGQRERFSIEIYQYNSECRIKLYEMYFLNSKKKLFIREEYFYEDDKISFVNKYSYPGQEFNHTEYYYYKADSLKDYEKIDSTWNEFSIVVNPSEYMRIVRYKDKNSINRVTFVSQKNKIIGETWLNSNRLVQRVFTIDDYNGCWGESIFNYNENLFPKSTIYKCHNSYESYKNNAGKIVKEETYEFEIDVAGNWIKKTVFDKTDSGDFEQNDNGTVKRTIQYFQ